jgi:hypothetical protein
MPVRGYILTRTDLPSLNNGKAFAHAFHAGNQLTWNLIVKPLLDNQLPNKTFMEWHGHTGFGTAVALGNDGITLQTMKDIMLKVSLLGDPDIHADLVVDESYPYDVNYEMFPLIDPKFHSKEPHRIRDGWRCYREETTAMYVIGETESLKSILGNFSLKIKSTLTVS